MPGDFIACSFYILSTQLKKKNETGSHVTQIGLTLASVAEDDLDLLTIPPTSTHSCFWKHVHLCLLYMV